MPLSKIPLTTSIRYMLVLLRLLKLIKLKCDRVYNDKVYFLMINTEVVFVF